MVTLALGIRANAAIFALLDALVLRSLPVPNPAQLLQLKMGRRRTARDFRAFPTRWCAPSRPSARCSPVLPDSADGVAQRTKEIGIRMALGAPRRGVIALVVSGAWRPLFVGLALGVPAAWAASRWIESRLFGLKPTDPASLAIAVVALVAVAHAAAWLPARRAARLDPLIALRSE